MAARVISPSTHENNATGEAHGGSSFLPANSGLTKPFATRLNEISSIGNRFKRARAVAAIADDLDLAQVRAALDEMVRAGGFRSDDEREEIAEKLLARWGELDPRTAIERAMTFPINRGRTIRAVLQGWAGKDVKAAEEWVVNFNSPLKETARRGLVLGVADTDPKRAFALLEGLSQWGDPSLMEAVFSAWTEIDPTDAAAHAAQLPDGYFRKSSLDLIAEHWAKRDSASAVAWAESLPSDDAARSKNTIPFQSDALITALNTWMDHDAEGARQWIEQIPDEGRRSELFGALVLLAGDKDPPRAAQLLTDLIPPGKKQDDAFSDLAWRWSNSDPRGALAWAAGQTDAHVREVIVPKLVRGFSEFQNLDPQDTQTALQLAQSLSGSAQQNATRYVLGAWAANDPAAAAAWAAPYSSNAEYLRSVAFKWVEKDPDAASQWVNSLPAGAAKDDVLSFAAYGRTVGIDPAVAAGWITGIADAPTREASLKTLAGNWLKADVKAAREWISHAPLAQEVKDQLLKTDAR